MDEVSAFAVYKKGTGKKTSKKLTPKKTNKLETKSRTRKHSNGSPGKLLPEPIQKDAIVKTKGGLNVRQQESRINKKIDKVPSEKLDNGSSAKDGECSTDAEIPTTSLVVRKRKQSETIVEPSKGIVKKPAPKRKKQGKETPAEIPPIPEEIPKDVNGASAIKKEPPSPSSNLPLRNNSIRDGSKLFKWLLSPIGVDKFMEKFWEKSPCLVERNDPTYFNKLISFEMIDQMLVDNHIEFTKNIDITSYKNGARETLNPEGRAMPPVVWDHYSNGCSIRLLNPQTFMPAIFAMNTTLQEFFHCMVGSNSYLTPPNSQGFAPHYDDIEAFVLQIEGRKRWRLYNPKSKREELPRFSSENFSQTEIGNPILEKVLMPGDMLYFPRGTIHQAVTEPGFHSLHITLSVYQKQSYADLMEKMFPLILQRAIAENVDFRRGLPMSVWHNAGIVFSDVDTRERQDFLRKCRDLISKALKEIPVDQAVDQLAKKYQHEALPPEITADEKARTVFGSKNIVNAEGQCVLDYEIDTKTKVRLLRKNILRLIEEEDKIRVYYYVDNSKEYCEYDPNYIEIEPDDASSVEVLIKSYPEYVAVNELPLEDDERKISVVQALWERGLLMFDRPYNC